MPSHQLTTDERYQITYLSMHGRKPAEIARRMVENVSALVRYRVASRLFSVLFTPIDTRGPLVYNAFL